MTCCTVLSFRTLSQVSHGYRPSDSRFLNSLLLGRNNLNIHNNTSFWTILFSAITRCTVNYYACLRFSEALAPVPSSPPQGTSQVQTMAYIVMPLTSGHGRQSRKCHMRLEFCSFSFSCTAFPGKRIILACLYDTHQL
jgi:hypothetical protein